MAPANLNRLSCHPCKAACCKVDGRLANGDCQNILNCTMRILTMTETTLVSAEFHLVVQLHKPSGWQHV
jgi:hypothetical protein